MGDNDDTIQKLQAEAGILRLSLREVQDWMRLFDPAERLKAVEQVLSGDAGRKGLRDLELSKTMLRRILEWVTEIKDDDPETLDPYKAHKAATVVWKLAGETLEVLNGRHSSRGDMGQVVEMAPNAQKQG